MSVENEGSSPEISQQTMIQYLLGELPPAWQEQFEERFFSDKESFEQLKRVEDQLIDDYVSQVLSEQQRERFESHYLNSDRRRQKLKFAQALKQSLAELEPRAGERSDSSSWQLLKLAWQRPIFRYSFIGVAVLLLAVGGWLCLSAVQLRKQRQQLEAERAARAGATQPTAPAVASEITPQPTPATIASPSKQAKAESSATTIVSFVLSPGLFRDDAAQLETRTLRVTPQTRMIHLNLALPGKETLSAYRVVIESASGQIVLTRSGVRPVKTRQNNFIQLALPVQTLPANDYLVTLSAKRGNGEYEEVEDYQFRIVKRP